MKILFYNHTGHVSGAERVMQMILRGLERERYQPVVACPENSKMLELARGEGASVRGLTSLEARFTLRPDRLVRYLLSFARVIREARALVIDEKPDLIHANSIRAGLVMAAATAGLATPVIWHAHDILPHHPLSTLVRLFAASSPRNHILAVSNAVAKRFRGLLLRPFRSRVPITVVHNAVDLERFRPDRKAGAEVRHELNLTGKQPVVGIVGQLTPRKGQLELIEAMATVTHEIPDCVLLIAGEAIFNRDEDYARLLRQTTRSCLVGERVRFLGARSDVPRLLQAMDILVINSHEEPFALTVLEGLASGIAVLGTAVGGTPEMIEHHRNGYLVPPRDVPSLAEALINLLSDYELRARMGSTARETAIARFSTSRFISEIELLYLTVITPKLTTRTGQKLNEEFATD